MRHTPFLFSPAKKTAQIKKFLLCFRYTRDNVMLHKSSQDN